MIEQIFLKGTQPFQHQAHHNSAGFWLTDFEVSSFGEGVIWPTVPYLLTIVSGLAVLRTTPHFAGAPLQKRTSNLH
ncbi:hypothetical protein [Microcoleus sp. FACHB-672]|uniref:hypothetical protein n=1 Tax=Microcoleus sp. FACHB-672 TaxID=2692825 RepID=UPI001688E2F7|nr:hypothetical protein [Microcoleus sp. FACHB-672]MBD2039102.1 hypothetical protein [Microcoleus sp. FACHB-672]